MLKTISCVFEKELCTVIGKVWFFLFNGDDD